MNMTNEEKEFFSFLKEFNKLKEQVRKNIGVYKNNIGTFYDKWDCNLFWELNSKLVKNISCDKDVKRAVHNLASYHVNKWSYDEGGILNNWKELVRYENSYRALTNEISKIIWDLPGLHRGDDAFGDLCDALPLSGKSVIELIINKKIDNYGYLLEVVDKGEESLSEMILNGENYILMTIDDKNTEFLSSVIFGLDLTIEKK